MTLAIARKDLAALWATPIPYVVGALFQGLLGVLMVNQLEVRTQAVVQPLFPLAGFLLLLTVPVLAMRSLADENRSGSIDLLHVANVAPSRIVVGKWLATWVTSLVVLAPAGVYAVLVQLWGNPDGGPVITGFIGLVLLAALLAALGTLTSAATTSQPIAAMSSLAVVLVLWFANRGSEAITAGRVLERISLSERIRSFASGGIDTGDLAFFVLITLVGLALSAIVIDARKLR